MADTKGNYADDDAAKKCLFYSIACNGESCGKCIHGSSDGLNHEIPEAGLELDLFFFTCKPFFNHHEPQRCKNEKRNPGYVEPDNLKEVRYPIHSQPAEKGHEELEESKGACNEKNFLSSHERFMNSIGQRHRKSIHGKTDA